MQNKAKDFPSMKINGDAGKGRAKDRYASKRADGTTNTHPQERMEASNQRTTD
ncbi:small, acid-soluble spore protein K [Jeotgalibacillus marinus]|uniref:Small, acid-soluble spore protein K n=1 Tax=Jeotgalibacillus marinus TaxID=86667 RepID=A0ABV3Q5Y7_9BACL